MGKVTRAVADEHRNEIVRMASKLFRERGADQVTIPEVMSQVGLTRGGFYRHFNSKEALRISAIDLALSMVSRLLERISSRRLSHENAMSAFTSFYLSESHQKGIATGCPYSAMAGDIAREPAGSQAKGVLAQGFETHVRALAALGGRDDAELSEQDINDAIVRFSTVVGATILARATAGNDISGQILRATRTNFGLPADG